MIISAAGCIADQKNINTTSSKLRKEPASISDLQTILGLVGYFQLSIPNFSQTAHRFYQLLKKNHSTQKPVKELIEWQEIQQAVSNQHLQHLVTPPILAYLDCSKPFILYTDA